MKTRGLCVLAAAALAAATGTSLTAATVVGWTSPPDGSVFAVGTVVSPTGQASGVGGIGNLELALVLDSSGSMTSIATAGGTTQSLRLWQQDAANAMVNALNPAGSSVAVVEFDSSASTLAPLTPLSTGLSTVQNAINSVDASGRTNIGSGITLGQSELSAGNAGAAKHMVVSSDGFSSGNPAAAAAAAAAAGITVHSIALPGASISTMQAIATAGGGTFVDASDPSSLDSLVALLAGIGGNLVNIDHVDIIDPDGVTHANVAVSGLGQFSAPSYALKLGANVFKAIAYGTDGSSASADLTLFGATSAVPEPGSMALLASGLIAVVVSQRRRLKR